MFPGFLPVQDAWRLRGRWIQAQSVDRVDPSPRDLHQSTCLKKGISENDQEAYLMTRGGTRYVGSPSRFDHDFIGCWFIGRSRSSHQSDGWRWTLLTIVAHWIEGSRSSIQLKLHRTAGYDRKGTPRSRPDRTAIATRSSCDRGSFVVESNHDRWMVYVENWKHDRRPIMADRGAIVA